MHKMYNIFHNYMFRPILGHFQVVYTKQPEDVYTPYCTHIEDTLSAQVGLKMAAMRPKQVGKNH